MKMLFFLLLFFLISCSNHHPAPVTERQHGKVHRNSSQPLSKQRKFKPKYIHVKKGDTLYSLGFSHNIDFKTLARINHIPAPYRIYPGQKLNLSRSANKTHPHNEVSKVVTKPSKKPKIAALKRSQKTTLSTTTTKPIQQPKKKPQSQPTPEANNRWMWPVKGKIISTFSQTDTSRKGVDIASVLGSKVYASNHGTVVYSGDGLRGYGELIIIKHSNNLLSAYAHNSKRLVKEGLTVKQGEVIAKSGKGTDGRPLLHFEIRKNGQPVNPLKYLPKK